MNKGNFRITVDTGLLVLRVGLGIMFMVHGYPKLFSGPEKWAQLGGVMGILGITFAPVFWGLMASIAEFLGGLLLIIGVGTRVAASFMLFTMFMAAVMHLSQGDGILRASHAIEAGIAFLTLALTGAGAYSIDRHLFNRKT